MKVKVDKNLCIGCGACQSIEPSVFELEDDGLAKAIDTEINGLAKAIDTEINKEIKENVMDAIEGCPTSAISEVK